MRAKRSILYTRVLTEGAVVILVKDWDSLQPLTKIYREVEFLLGYIKKKLLLERKYLPKLGEVFSISQHHIMASCQEQIQSGSIYTSVNSCDIIHKELKIFLFAFENVFT